MELRVTYKKRSDEVTEVLRKVGLTGTVLTLFYYTVQEQIIADFILYGAKF